MTALTALERVRRARRSLMAAAAFAALVWGAAAALGVIGAAALANSLFMLGGGARAAILPLAALAALAAVGALVWRWRMARSVERVALWIEERQPELRYTLVTAVDPAAASQERYPELHERARAADIAGIVGQARRRVLGRAFLFALPLALLVAALEPVSLLEEARSELARRMAEPAPAPLGNRLEGMSAVITPPAYSRLPDEVIEEPTAVAALVGSEVAFGGWGPGEGVVAVVEGDTVGVEGEGVGEGEGEEGWEVVLDMPEEPVVVSFQDRDYRRLVVLEPRPDSVPSVRLRLPASDTVYRTVPSGRLEVEARASDDVGLDYGYIEYMVTTGGGEHFETRRTEGRRLTFENARRGTLREAVRLDTMGLGPGTVLHIRAIALDHNDISGPGRGVSETRTLRIAEPEDSVSVAPIPPIPIDSMWISQRLLNMKTDTLLMEREALDRRTYVSTSSAYGGTQDEIRLRTLGVISNLEDDGVGGAFETEISLKLREAADLMYEARVHLGVGEPDLAMPIMVRILEILDEIRLANRYYMRGLIRAEAIDVERVRLSGEDPASREARRPRAALADSLAPLAERIERALALIGTAPIGAVPIGAVPIGAVPTEALDSLVYTRVAALSVSPEVAAAMAELIEVLQGRVPASPSREGAAIEAEAVGETGEVEQSREQALEQALERALARIRRALEPAPVQLQGPVEWGGVP